MRPNGWMACQTIDRRDKIAPKNERYEEPSVT